MKKLLLKLGFLGAGLLIAQMGFGQLGVVSITSTDGGKEGYTNISMPIGAVSDGFTYDPNTYDYKTYVNGTVYNDDDPASNAHPKCVVGATATRTNLFHSDGSADVNTHNWWSCEFSITTGKMLSHLDFWGRQGVQTNSGMYDRVRNLHITISDGVNTEKILWVDGITPALNADEYDMNYNRADFVALGFSVDLLKNATTLRIDQDTHITRPMEIEELRLLHQDAISNDIDDTKATKMAVSPNPLQGGALKIALEDKTTDEVQVYSVQGTLVYETIAEGSEVLIDYAVFPSAGIYMVKVGSAVTKVVVK